MAALFRLYNVTKRYRSREVLNIRKMEVNKGRIYTILGPNGAGKTTLLRVMSLLTVNDSGRIEVFGEEVSWNKSQLVRLRRHMAMVTQTSFMFKGSVYYNVAYGLKVRKRPEPEQRKIVKECLELMGMSDFADYPAQKLSGGERQKVAIARALAVKPEVLFLDEPTSSLEPNSAMDIEHYIKFINSQYNTTVIMVTHNLFQARRLAEEIFFLWDGKIIEHGSCEDLFTRARDERTRAFLQGNF